MTDVTATNPQTGERIVYRNGAWQPLAGGAAAAPAGQTIAQRSQTATGPQAVRGAVTAGARVQQRQTGLGEDETGTLASRLQLLGGLGRARRLIEGDTPTGPNTEVGLLNWSNHHDAPTTPGSMGMARLLPWAQGQFGIPSTQQLTNLGELDKLSTLAATAVAGQTTTGMDAQTRANIRSALFDVERSQGENRRNVNYLLHQYVTDAIAMRAAQAWRARYGDETAVDQNTGLNLTDYIAALSNQIPRDGDAFETRGNYNTNVRSPNGGSLNLPEVSGFVDNLVHGIRGELGPEGSHPAAAAPSAPPAHGWGVTSDGMPASFGEPGTRHPPAPSATPTPAPAASAYWPVTAPAAHALLAGAGTDAQFDLRFGPGAAARVRASARGQH